MFLFSTLWACSLIRACSFPRQCFSTPNRLHIVHRREPEPLFTEVRGIRILGSSYPRSRISIRIGPVPSFTPPLAQCYGGVRVGSSLWTGLASIRSWCRRPVLGFHALHTPSSLERGSPRRCTETFCLPAFALALLPYAPSL